MSVLVDTPLARRVILGIEWCETCGCDTIPLERTGRCAWCNSQLVEPDAARPPRCLECHEEIEGRRGQKFCSQRCCWRASQRSARYRRSLGGTA